MLFDQSSRLLTLQSVLLLLLACASPALTLGQEGLDESTSFFLSPREPKATTWAVQKSTGRIFVAKEQQKKIVEYNRAGEVIRETETPLTVQHLVFKQDRLVVVYGDERWRGDGNDRALIAVFDLESNRLAPLAQLPGNCCVSLFCSQVDNDYVFALVRDHDPSRRLRPNPYVIRVDLRDASIEKASAGEWPIQSTEGMLTDCGRYLRLRNEVFSFDESSVTLGKKFLRGTEVTCADPVGRFWGHAGSPGITNLLGIEVGETANVLAFHPKYSFCLAGSRNGDKIKFSPANGTRSNNFKSVKNIGGDYLQTLFDDQDRAYYCTSRGCQIIDLKQFTNLNSYFLIKAPKRIDVTVGQELEFQLLTFTGEVDEPAEFSIEPKSDSVVIENNRVRWTPSNEKLGVNKWAITAESKSGKTDTFEIEVDVKSASRIETGIAIKAFYVDRPGTRALVWGRKFDESTNPRDLAQLRGKHVIKMVDLESQTVIAESEVESIHTASLDDKYVYVISQNRQQLLRLDRDTLANGQAIRVKQSYSGEIMLFPLGSNVFFNDRVNCHVVDRETLKVIERSSSDRLKRTRHAYDQIEFDGRVVNIDTGELLAVTLRPWYEGKSQRHVSDRRQENPYLGRNLDHRLLMTQATVGFESHAKQGERQSFGQALSPNGPLVYEVFCRRKKTFGFEGAYELEARRLSDKALVSQAVVSNFPQKFVSQDRAFVSGRVRTGADKIVLARLSSLEIHPLPEIEPDMSKPPLNLKYPSCRPVISSTPFEFQSEVGGGENEVLSFELIKPGQGLAINSESGLISFDVPRVWEKFVDQKATQLLWIEKRYGEPVGADYRRADLGNSPTASEVFQDVYGEALEDEKYPLAVPFEVYVRNEDGSQEDSCKFWLTIVGDKSDFEVAKKRIVDRLKRVALASGASAFGFSASSTVSSIRTVLLEGSLQSEIQKARSRNENN
jgi:dipeptidyl aminopeptidase/acylaminoacyl peptidase